MTNAAPIPLADTQISLIRARVIAAGVELGVFEALADGPGAAEDVARRCGTDPRATRSLLRALVGARYLTLADGAFALTPVSRKWLTERSPHSLADKMRLQTIEVGLLEHLEDFVRTGRPAGLHERLDAKGWDLYQRGMHALAALCGDEVGRRTVVPRGAHDMLDIGGSHGVF